MLLSILFGVVDISVLNFGEKLNSSVMSVVMK